MYKHGEKSGEYLSEGGKCSDSELMSGEEDKEYKYEYREPVTRLSQKDKYELWQGQFVICSIIISVCVAITGAIHAYSYNQRYKQLEETLDWVASYMASATKDEYAGIAQTLRHDLIFSDYNEGIKFLAEHIPNTAKACRIDGESLPAQVYLVSTNTGELYPLDLFMQEEGENNLAEKPGKMDLSFAYDEVSRTSVHIIKNFEEEQVSATLYRHYGIVSLQRMKTIFCDDCIDKILDVVEGRGISEFMLFDALENTFHPIADGTTLQIGDYSLTIVCINNDYKILME